MNSIETIVVRDVRTAGGPGSDHPDPSTSSIDLASVEDVIAEDEESDLHASLGREQVERSVRSERIAGRCGWYHERRSSLLDEGFTRGATDVDRHIDVHRRPRLTEEGSGEGTAERVRNLQVVEHRGDPGHQLQRPARRHRAVDSETSRLAIALP
mgnify:CR=1 FL=1